MQVYLISLRFLCSLLFIRLAWGDSLLVLRLFIGKNRGQFEIHETEAAVGLAIRHVANLGVVVADAVFLQLGEELLQSLVVQVIDATAAARGANEQALRSK